MEQTQSPIFDSRAVSGRAPAAMDSELPQVLEDLYQVAGERRERRPSAPDVLPPGWSRVSDNELFENGIDPRLLHDPQTGFDAGFYRGPLGQVVLAFCGTDQLNDWTANLGQGLGVPNKQYQDAIGLAIQAKASFGTQLVLSGHSLGGGLASAAAVVTAAPAVTFNSAGIHGNTLARESLDPAAAREVAKDGLVRSYHVRNELLTHLQERNLVLRWVMPDAIGHRIELPDPDPISLGQRLVPGMMLKHRLDLHGIQAVMESMTLQQLRDAEQGKPVASPVQGVGSRLLEDAVFHLEPQRERLGLNDSAALFNVAAGLAANSGADGMSRIDHIVVNSERVFSVQGGLHDPAHQRSHVRLGEEPEHTLPMYMARLRDQQTQHDHLVPRLGAHPEPEHEQRLRLSGMA